MLGNIFMFILKLFSPFLLFICIVIIHLLARFFYHFVLKKEQLPKRGEYKESNFLKRIAWDFPKQYIDDIRNSKDFEFKEYGVHIVCGEQGSGKTTTVVYLLNKWRKLYPMVEISSNLDYAHDNSPITHWKDVVNSVNGIHGKVEVIDEIQAWFSSNQSKDFPPEMLQEVSQQRKQRKAIIGTAQVFSRISKPIREQTHFVYLPMTLFGCITIVRKSHAKYWNDEKQKFTQYMGFFMFVHDKDIRDSFDTFKKIEKYAQVGFKSDNDRLEISA